MMVVNFVSFPPSHQCEEMERWKTDEIDDHYKILALAGWVCSDGEVYISKNGKNPRLELLQKFPQHFISIHSLVHSLSLSPSLSLSDYCFLKINSRFQGFGEKYTRIQLKIIYEHVVPFLSLLFGKSCGMYILLLSLIGRD